MAKDIKGITIRIGGDTTGLQDALKGVNSQIRDSQQSLREVEKALKLDPSNVELLEQKQNALTQAVDATKEKLETLKEAQKQMKEAGVTDENRAQYEALTREIIKTEDALNKAEEASKNFNVSLEQAKTKLSKVAAAAQKVSDKTKALSTAAAGLVAGIGGIALKSAAAADDLNTLSKQTGLSTDEIQKFKYASDLVDVSLDSMTGALSRMTKQLSSESGEAKFAALGVSVRDSSGALRDSTSIFYDTLAALSQVSNETERDVLAMDLFGRSANELAGIIDDGGAALKQYGTEAEQLGLIMDEETLTSLNAVNDEVDKLKAKATGEIAKVGASALEALAPVFDTIIEKISSLLEWLGSLDADALKIILTVAAVIAAISPIAGLIATITTAINGVITVLPILGGAMNALPIVAIIGLVAALAVAVITHWDEIKAVLSDAWAKVQDVFGKIKDFISAAGDSINETWTNIKTAAVNAWTSITDSIKEKINVIIGYANQLIDLVNGLTSRLNNSFLGKALNLDVGQIDRIQTLALSGGSGAVTNNSTTINYNTSPTPLQVNVQLDSNTLARGLVNPMGKQYALAGASNIIG